MNSSLRLREDDEEAFSDLDAAAFTRTVRRMCLSLTPDLPRLDSDLEACDCPSIFAS